MRSGDLLTHCDSDQTPALDQTRVCLTCGNVFPLETLTVVDVRPGDDQVMMCGAGLHVPKTQQLLILFTHTHTEGESSSVAEVITHE